MKKLKLFFHIGSEGISPVPQSGKRFSFLEYSIHIYFILSTCLSYYITFFQLMGVYYPHHIAHTDADGVNEGIQTINTTINAKVLGKHSSRDPYQDSTTTSAAKPNSSAGCWKETQRYYPVYGGTLRKSLRWKSAHRLCSYIFFYLPWGPARCPQNYAECTFFSIGEGKVNLVRAVVINLSEKNRCFIDSDEKRVKIKNISSKS